MGYRVEVSRKAKDDVDTHVDTLRKKAPEAALRLISHFDHILDLIADSSINDSLYRTPNSSLYHIRLYRIPEFEKYLVFFQYIDNFVIIIRVLYATDEIEHVLANQPVYEGL